MYIMKKTVYRKAPNGSLMCQQCNSDAPVGKRLRITTYFAATNDEAEVCGKCKNVKISRAIRDEWEKGMRTLFNIHKYTTVKEIKFVEEINEVGKKVSDKIHKNQLSIRKRTTRKFAQMMMAQKLVEEINSETEESSLDEMMETEDSEISQGKSDKKIYVDQATNTELDWNSKKTDTTKTTTETENNRNENIAREDGMTSETESWENIRLEDLIGLPSLDERSLTAIAGGIGEVMECWTPQNSYPAMESQTEGDKAINMIGEQPTLESTHDEREIWEIIMEALEEDSNKPVPQDKSDQSDHCYAKQANPPEKGKQTMEKEKLGRDTCGLYDDKSTRPSRELGLCSICEKSKDVLLMPCKHVVICQTCAVKMEHCSQCKVKIQGTITML